VCDQVPDSHSAITNEHQKARPIGADRAHGGPEQLAKLIGLVNITKAAFVLGAQHRAFALGFVLLACGLSVQRNNSPSYRHPAFKSRQFSGLQPLLPDRRGVQ